MNIRLTYGRPVPSTAWTSLVAYKGTESDQYVMLYLSKKPSTERQKKAVALPSRGRNHSAQLHRGKVISRGTVID